MNRSCQTTCLLLIVFTLSQAVTAQSATWDPLPCFVPVERSGMAYDPGRQRIVMFGGQFTQDGSGRSRETREWDGDRWYARRLSVSPPPRTSCGMTYDFVRQKIVIFGGHFMQDPSVPPAAVLQDMWEYDGQTWQQIPTQMTSWPPVRTAPAMASDPIRDRIVLFGGVDLNWYLNDTWEWDGSSWQQMAPTTVPTRRFGASMAYCILNQRMLMMAGGPGLQVDWFYEWDGTNWNDLSNRTGNPPGRGGFLVSTPWNGHVVQQWSGDAPNNRNVYYNQTWDYDGSTWSQLPTANRPGMGRRDANVREFPPRQSIMMANGWYWHPGSQQYPPEFFSTDPTDRAEDYWVLESGDWHHIRTEVRERFPAEAATYDPVQDRTIIVANPSFDGPSVGDVMETWALEGDRLRLLSPVTCPPYRIRPRMVRHEALGKILLFGGGRWPQNLPRDTWTFDGSQWVEDTLTQGAMPTVYTLAMVYDGARSQVVLMFAQRPDLWVWNGRGWSTWTAGQLPFQPLGVLGYDPSRQRLVYFGDVQQSTAGPVIRDQLYEFDGTVWQQIQAPQPFTTFKADHFLYVPWLGGLVLVPREGWPYNGVPADRVWVWNGANWNSTLVDRPLFDSYKAPVTGTRAGATYDTARGELQVLSQGEDTYGTGSFVWRLKRRMLRLSTHHPRLTERLSFTLHAQGHAGRIGVVLLSGTNFPSTPIGAVDRQALQLANDPLLQISVGLGLWTVLDAQGRGTLQLGAIPNDPRLLGMGLYAGGLILDPQSVTFSTTTNAEPFDVNR